MDGPFRDREQDGGGFGRQAPAGEDRDESDRHRKSHSRNDDRVGGETGERDPMEVDRHRQREAGLHGGGGQPELEDKER